MPFKVTDKQTGKIITFENQPSDEDLNEAFGIGGQDITTAMTPIQEIRQKYPQYDDMSDEKLASSLHEKYYSDIPKEEFNSKIGLQTAKEPSFYQKWVKPIAEPVVEAAGLIGGGIVGAGAGIVGAPIGAGLGYAGAKQAYRTAEELAGVSEPAPLPEQLLRTGKEVATGATYEMGGQVAGKVIGSAITKGKEKLSAPFKKKVIPEIAEAGEEMARIGGTGLSPAQKTESGFIDFVENVAEKSLAGAPKFTTFRGRQEESIGKFADDIVDKTWEAYGSKLSPVESGQLFKSVVDKKIDVFESTAEGLYKNVDSLVKGIGVKTPLKQFKWVETGVDKVSLTPIKSFANNLLKSVKARAGIGASKMGDTLIKKIIKLPDTVDFSTAQSIRTGFGKEIEAMKYTKDINSGIAKQSFKLISEQMDKAAMALNPEAKVAFNKATTFYREGYDTFYNKFVSKMLQKVADNPEVIVDYVKNAKTGDLQKILALTDDATKQVLKASYVEKIINDSMGKGDVVIGKSFLAKLRDIGNDKLKLLFKPEDHARFLRLGIAAKAAQTPVGGGGGMMIQLTQWGPILSLPTSIVTGNVGYAAAGGGLLVTTHQLAKIMTHPVYSKWFAEGLKTTATSPKAIELAIKLAGILKFYETEKSLSMEDIQKLKGESTLR